MNIIFQDHIAINLHAESKESDKIVSICFPQAYRDNIEGKNKEQVFETYYSSQNKVIDAVPNYGKWWYIRCAYSHYDQRFYFNDKVDLVVEPEKMLEGKETITNINSFRYFPKNFVNLIIEGASENFTRIFMQTLNLYSEYLPYNLDLRNKNMKWYIGYFKPLIFSVDFDEYDESYRGLKWYYHNINEDFHSSTFVYDWLFGFIPRFYISYPIYVRPIICDHLSYYDTVSKSCQAGIPLCNEKTNFCNNSSTNKFWCENNKYLDISNFSCNSDCPIGFTRKPNSYDKASFCDLECSTSKITGCPNTNIDIIYNQYKSIYTCDSGFLKIYYMCFEENDSLKTATLYFNGRYSFNNIYSDLSNNELTEHIVEAWIMMDNIYPPYLNDIKNRTIISMTRPPTNTFTVGISSGGISSSTFIEDISEEFFTYLLIYPHALVMKKNERLIRYANFYSDPRFSKFSQELNSFRYSEWNRIIIHNKVDKRRFRNQISVYVNNQIMKPDHYEESKSDLYDMAIKGIYFCNDQENETCKVGSKNYRLFWGSAFYKNIKIFQHLSSSLDVVLNYEKLFSDKIDGLLSYIDFKIQNLSFTKISDFIKSPSNDLNIKTYLPSKLYDEDQLLNYVINYDPVPNEYTIDSFTSKFANESILQNPLFYNFTNLTSYEIKSCQENCLRCFSTNNTDCYLCISGYFILRGKCIKEDKSYLKLPILKTLDPLSQNQEIILKKSSFINNTSSNIDSQKISVNPITITFWFKFFGVIRNNPRYASKTNFLIMGLYTDPNEVQSTLEPNNNYLGWDITNKKINLMYKTSRVAFSSEYSDNFGKWTHIGLSVYNALPVTETRLKAKFPNMINFMIDKTIISKDESFNIESAYFYINKLSLGEDISALISQIRIYNHFFIGTFGYSQSNIINSSEKNILNINLQGTSIKNCYNSNLFEDSISNNENLCKFDINEYLEPLNDCKNNTSQYKEINTLKKNPECKNCSDYCPNYCYSENNNKTCSCNYDQPGFWIREINKTNSSYYGYEYYCEKLPSINIAYYNEIKLNNIKPGGSRYILETWIYIDEYVTNSFIGGDIIWDKFSRIKIDKTEIVSGPVNFENLEVVKSTNNSIDQIMTDLKISCYPYVDNNFLNTEKTFFVETTAKKKEWFFVRCSTNLGSNKVSINGQEEKEINLILPPIPHTTNTTLTLKDTKTEDSYGVFMIRELRLWNGPSYLFYDTDRIRLDPTSYQTLIHYFINSFDFDKTEMYRIYDAKLKTYQNITRSTNIPGYNYIKNYKNLTICYEGEIYNKEKDICRRFNLQDFLENLNTGQVYQPAELNIRSKAVNALTKYVHKKEYLNISYVTPDFQSFNFTGHDVIKDREYCFNQGDANQIVRLLTCSCYQGFSGEVCHLQKSDYNTLFLIYRRFAAKIWETALLDQSEVVLESILMTIEGANRFLNEPYFIDDIFRNLTFFFDDLTYRESHLNNWEYFLIIYEKLYSGVTKQLHQFKGELLKARFPLGNGPKNIDLNYLQKYIYREFMVYYRKKIFELIERGIIYQSVHDVKYPFKGKGEFSYNGTFISLDIIRVNPNFDFKSFKMKKSEKYLSFIDMEKCLTRISKNVYFTDFYDFWIVLIDWISPPAAYEETIYLNYTSNSLTMKLYKGNGEEVRVIGCDNGDELIFYNPLVNTDIVETINSRKHLLTKDNFYPYNATIFTDPWYIDPTGEVHNTTREERIEKHYVNITLDFVYYDINENQPPESEQFHNFTYDSNNSTMYFISKSTHLTDFLLNYKLQNQPDPVNTRFYFLGRPELFKRAKNWFSNVAFYMLIALPLLYFILTFIFTRRQSSLLKEKGFEDLLDDQYMTYIFPYGNPEEEYDPNKPIESTKLKIKVIDEDKKKLNNSPAPEVIRLKENEEDPELMKKKNDIIQNIDSEANKLNDKDEKKLKDNDEASSHLNNHESLQDESKSSENNESDNEKYLPFKRKKLDENQIDPYANTDMNIVKEKLFKNTPKIDNPKEEKVEKEVIEEHEESLNKSIDVEFEDEIKIQKNNFIENADKPDILTTKNLTTDRLNDDSNQKKLLKRKLLVQNLDINNETQRLKDLQNLNLDACDFYWKNIKNRHLFVTLINSGKQFYMPYLRIGYFFFYIYMILLFTTIGILFSPNLEIAKLSEKGVLSSLILVSIFPVILTNIILYIIHFFVYIKKSDMRRNLKSLRKNYDEFLVKDWPESLAHQNLFVYIFFGILLLIVLVSFYFSFGFCAVYKSQVITYLICFGANIVIDLLLFEFLVEAIIMLFYSLKENNICLNILYFLNTFKSDKVLAP